MYKDRVRYLVAFIAGYLVGGFPTGVVLTRRKYGIDVREMGSGNIGATNVTRVFGWYAGVLVLLIDFLKGFLPLWAIQHYWPDDPWLLTAAGTALVLGHCFSPFLKLRGGKGVATSLGCLAIAVPYLALAATATYAALLIATRISAVGSLGGIITAAIYLAIARPAEPAAALVASISFIVVVRHRSNIVRLWETFRRRKRK